MIASSSLTHNIVCFHYSAILKEAKRASICKSGIQKKQHGLERRKVETFQQSSHPRTWIPFTCAYLRARKSGLTWGIITWDKDLDLDHGVWCESLSAPTARSAQVIYLAPVVDNSSKVTGDAPSATGVPTLTDDRRLRLRWRMRFRRQLHKKCGWLVVGDCWEAGSAIWSDGGHRRWEIELVGMRDRDVGEEELLREGKNSGD
jgi:hypothetical protein